MILDTLNEICREVLEGWKQEDREAEALYYGHLRHLNETWMDDIQRRQMVGVAWEIAATIAILGGFGLLIYFMESMR